MSATRDLLDFAAAEHDLSGQVRAATERLIGDTLAVGAAGWSGLKIVRPMTPRRWVIHRTGGHFHKSFARWDAGQGAG